MIHLHTLPWDKCLSHQLMPAIKKGWKDNDRDIHFFWGLAGQNIRQIKECEERGDEWWYVDVGYLTEQITRYPTPIINNYDTTYFRICKGNIHTIRGKIGDGTRVTKLEQQGIDVQFKGWLTGETNHILLCPSSPTVTYHINGISQEDWIEQVTNEIKKHTDREVRLRNKPRPGNQYWNTDIKDDLKDCHCVVTNMSLAGVDSIMNMVPAITHQRHVASFITSRDISKINKPMRPGHKTINDWIKMVADNQFTIQEIEDGIAFKVLQEQI